MAKDYKSPIDVCIYADDYKIGEMYDEAIMEAVLKVKVDVDKEELLKALEYDRGQYETGYEQGYIDGKQKWIPCSERLPEESGEYIVSVRNNGHSTPFLFVCVTFYGAERRAWYVREELLESHLEVVAWQPLPKPYMEDTE